MEDEEKTRQKLIGELAAQRQRLSELEALQNEHRLVEEELRRLKEFNEGLVLNMAEGIVVEDAQGCFTFINPAAVKLLGYQVGELTGRHWTSIVPPDQRHIVQAADERRARGMVDRYELQLVRTDGKRISVLVSGTPLSLAEEGHFTGSLAVFTDLSEFKQSERALIQRNQELATLYAATAATSSNLALEAVLQTVAEQMTHALKVSGCTLSLWHREENRIETMSDFSTTWPEDIEPPGTSYDLAEYPATRRVLETGKPLLVQHNDPNADEAERALLKSYGTYTLLMLPLIAQERVLGLVELIDDVKVRHFTTDDIRLAEGLASQAAVAIENARLYNKAQGEIAERRRAEQELQLTNAELQARNQELDAFAHTVAHDLKNPLASLIGFCSMLATRHSEISDAGLVHHLNTIEGIGRKMINIIDELLLLASVSKMEDIPLTILDMDDIVVQARQRLDDLSQQHQAEIRAPEGWPVARGYAPWVEEVWTNYLSNALKHSRHPPRLELGAWEQPDGFVRFWVQDNGENLTPDEQARLFTPFTRLHQTRAKGHGLGLSIVRQIVEKLGGQVGVECQPETGNTFFFTLPGRK